MLVVIAQDKNGVYTEAVGPFLDHDRAEDFLDSAEEVSLDSFSVRPLVDPDEWEPRTRPGGDEE